MKLSDAEIVSLLLDEQASDPATPAAGFSRIYAKATGLFIIDDAGTVTGPFGAAAGSAEYPWAVDVDPAMPAVSNTNWSTLDAAQAAHAYNALKESSGAQNAEIVFEVPSILTAGTWNLDLLHRKHTDRGIYTIALAEMTGSTEGSWTDIGTIDGYNGSEAKNQLGAITGFTVSTTARYRIRLKMATKNASSSNYRGSIQRLRLRRTA